jgi:hypothetical protein
LLRQDWQTYFGVFEGTYIRPPQWQKVSPAKRWTGRLAVRVFPRRFSVMRAFAAFQISSGTTASTSEVTHSWAGFRFQPLPSPRDFV